MSTSKQEVSLKAYKALEAKLVKTKLEKKELREENRRLRKDKKRINESRDAWKRKLFLCRTDYNLLEKRFLRQRNQKERIKPKGHQYATWLITLVVSLRIFCNCSYGSIVKILNLLHTDYLSTNSSYEDSVRIPCKETCQNWVSKAGYYYLQQTDNELLNTEVCLIIDESIRVGTEKLLLVLACRSEKIESGILTFEDVRVIYLKGSNSWKGDGIRDDLEKVLAEKGLKVSYIISDEGSNLVRAARLLNYPHLPDISHLIATCLKKTFGKDEAYQGFSKMVSKCQSKLAMGKYCFLRPYRQRVKARFLNQKKVIDWAETILDKWETLDIIAQEKLQVLIEHKPIIGELKECIHIGMKISKSLKTNGLNTKTIAMAIQLIDQKVVINESSNVSKRMNTFINYLKEYLVKYQNFINQEKWQGKTVHCCSDVIERLFGCYKAKVSDNYFVTATTIGLELPLMCLPKEELITNLQVALESVFMTDLKEWRTSQMSDNQSYMRTIFFKK